MDFNNIAAVVFSIEGQILHIYLNPDDQPDKKELQKTLFKDYMDKVEQYLIKDLEITMEEIDKIICKDFLDPIKIHEFEWNKEKNGWKENVLEKDFKKYIKNIK